MISILIDTSNTELAVGIAKEGKVFDYVRYEAWQRQSEFLIVELDGLLKKNELSRSDIQAVIVSKGPGSYTGVRIGLTVAKVMAVALNIPLYLVSSLSILRGEDGQKSLCLMNARASRSYVGLYEGEKVLIEDTIWQNEEVEKYLLQHPDVVACGNLSYLGKEAPRPDTLGILASSEKEEYREKDPLKTAPTYLKG